MKTENKFLLRKGMCLMKAEMELTILEDGTISILRATPTRRRHSPIQGAGSGCGGHRRSPVRTGCLEKNRNALLVPLQRLAGRPAWTSAKKMHQTAATQS